MATSAFSTRIARAHSASEHALVVGFVFGVREDAPLHPVGAFAVASTAIRAPGRFEAAKMLKHEDLGTMLFGKLDNASAHQVRDLLIDMGDLPPEVDIVLFALRYDARFAPVACNPS